MFAFTDEIFNNTAHPYSIALLSANPSSRCKTEMLKGELPSPIGLPNGCKFHTRCSKAFPKCIENAPEYFNISDTHFVKCYLYN